MQILKYLHVCLSTIIYEQNFFWWCIFLCKAQHLFWNSSLIAQKCLIYCSEMPHLLFRNASSIVQKWLTYCSEIPHLVFRSVPMTVILSQNSNHLTRESIHSWDKRIICNNRIKTILSLFVYIPMFILLVLTFGSPLLYERRPRWPSHWQYIRPGSLYCYHQVSAGKIDLKTL